jgi:hypothetical protein
VGKVDDQADVVPHGATAPIAPLVGPKAGRDRRSRLAGQEAGRAHPNQVVADDLGLAILGHSVESLDCGR